MSKPIPDLMTDEAAERLVDHADLTQHDLSGFVTTRFEFEAKAAQLNLNT
jgi:hypothetical protein